MPTIEVRFENLKVEADAYVGSRALPTFINFTSNIVEVERNSPLRSFLWLTYPNL